MKKVSELPEDYTSILPVYKESMPEAKTAAGSDMNTAIEKGQKLIKYHSITKQPKKKPGKKRKNIKKEYNNWVDDAYIMMGKANLYKGEYLQAENVFTQIVRLYKDEPAKYEAFIWLIRTYTEDERYTEAEELVSSLEGDDKFPAELGGELAVAAANLFIKQLKFDEAIQYLNIAVKKIKGNKRKTRYTFILAQLYRETGQNENALTAFQQVIRRRPNYEMLFNARILSAQVLSGSENYAILRKELNKMRRNQRNAQFLDQIYYALGNISYSEGKTNVAIEQYRLSVAYSVENVHQRALSAITLGDIYFDQRAYENSALYYDSAFAVISPDYPNYEKLNQRFTNLSQLSDHLNTVKAEDSLQYLATLSQAELDAKIESWINAAKAEAAKEESGGNGQLGSRYMNNRMRLGNTSTDWYFYNPSTVSYGKKEFERLWGKRKLEDNWRRSDKAISVDEGEMAEGETLADDIEAAEEEENNDPTTKEYYTKNIPVNDSLLAASHLRIRDALFSAGGLFKTEFDDLPSAAWCYQELNRRYPSNIYNSQSLFYLWDLYTDMEKPDSAAIYKDQILNYFPESNFARFLVNPNYFVELEARNDSINRLYSRAFDAYKQGDFKTAAQYGRQVASMTSDSTLKPKAEFIAMVSSNKSKSNVVLADSLQAYLVKYPNSEMSALASEIIQLAQGETLTNYQQLVTTGYLNDQIKNTELLGNTTAAGSDAAAPTQSKWDEDSYTLHYFVVVFPNDDKIDVNRLKFDVANYNLDHYTSLDFEIETEVLNTDTKLLVVRHLEDKENALIYFLSIIRKPEVFKTLASSKFYSFVISNGNFREMMNDKSYTEYLQFFIKNYSKFTTSDFSDEAFESPEALMAKLKAKETELKEKGEFVMVSTSDSSYVPELPAEQQIFVQGLDEPHEYALYVPQKGYQLGSVSKAFTLSNWKSFREKKLKINTMALKSGSLLSVSSFANADDALQYLHWTSQNKDLFQSLANVDYRTFVISKENLNKLKETNDADAYVKFYERQYAQVIRSAESQNKKVVEEKKDDQKLKTKAEGKDSKKQTAGENVDSKSEQPSKEESKANSETKKENLPAEKSDVQNPATSAVEEVNEDTSKAEEPKTEIQQVVEEPQEKTNVPYDGPYKATAEEKQYTVVVVPTQNFNKMILLNSVTRFNGMRYRSKNLKFVFEPLTSDMNVLLIETGDVNFSKEYLAALLADIRFTQSVRNVAYKTFIISESNLKLLKELKNPLQYEDFYKLNY